MRLQGKDLRTWLAGLDGMAGPRTIRQVPGGVPNDVDCLRR